MNKPPSVIAACLAGFMHALHLPTDLLSQWSVGQLLLLLILPAMVHFLVARF